MRDAPDRTIFLSTPSARRATLAQAYYDALDAISIHALREEGDIASEVTGNCCCISIHALREEGDISCIILFSRSRISIHALREEGDSTAYRYWAHGSNFYPRPPRGGRQAGPEGSAEGKTFLSTPSARRATA